MDKVFIVLSAAVTAGFSATVIILLKISVKKYIAAFVGAKEPNIKQDENLKRLIDEYKEG